MLSLAIALALLFALSLPVGAAGSSAQTRVYASVRTDNLFCTGTDSDLFRVAVNLSLGSGEPGIASYVVTVRWDPTALELVRTPQSYQNTGCCFTDAYSDGWAMIPAGSTTAVNVSMASQGQLTVASGSANNRARSNGTLFTICFRPIKPDVTTTVSVTPGSSLVSSENAFSSTSGAIRNIEERTTLPLHLIAGNGRLGDMNDDGQVNSMDYLLLKRHVLGTFQLVDRQLLLADTNRDGDVNSMDYLLLKRHVLGTFQLQ